MTRVTTQEMYDWKGIARYYDPMDFGEKLLYRCRLCNLRITQRSSAREYDRYLELIMHILDHVDGGGRE